MTDARTRFQSASEGRTTTRHPVYVVVIFDEQYGLEAVLGPFETIKLLYLLLVPVAIFVWCFLAQLVLNWSIGDIKWYTVPTYLTLEMMLLAGLIGCGVGIIYLTFS